MKKFVSHAQSKQPSLLKRKRTLKYSLPDDIRDGDLVQYYIDGWRAGYVVGVDGKGIKMQPIGSYRGSTPNTVHVPEEDVRIITKE
jgi:hypothetical protein